MLILDIWKVHVEAIGPLAIAASTAICTVALLARCSWRCNFQLVPRRGGNSVSVGSKRRRSPPRSRCAKLALMGRPSRAGQRASEGDPKPRYIGQCPHSKGIEFQACPYTTNRADWRSWTRTPPTPSRPVGTGAAQQGIVKVSILIREDFGLKWCLSERATKEQRSQRRQR